MTGCRVTTARSLSRLTGVGFGIRRLHRVGTRCADWGKRGWLPDRRSKLGNIRNGICICRAFIVRGGSTMTAIDAGARTVTGLDAPAFQPILTPRATTTKPITTLVPRTEPAIE